LFQDDFVSELKLLVPDADAAGERDHEPSPRDYFISLGTMEPRLKALTGVVFAQIVVSALALLLRGVPFAPIEITTKDGVLLSLSLLNYLISVVSLLTSLALLAAGLAYARWVGRWFFIIALSALYVFVVAVTFSEPLDKIGELVVFFCLPAIGFFIFAIPGLYRKNYTPERRHPAIYRTLQAIGVVYFVFFAFAFVAACLHPDEFADLLVLVRIPLPFLFLLAGTDWAEMDDSIVRSGYSLLRLAGRVDRSFALNVAVAVLAMGLTLYVTGWGVLQSFPVALITAGVGFVVLRPARINEYWPIRLPWAPLAFVVIASAVVQDAMGTPRGAMTPVFFAAAGAVFAALLITIRRLRIVPWLAPVVLYALVLWLDWGFSLLLPASVASQKPACFMFYVALASLVGLIWLRRTTPRERLDEPLRLILILNVSMLVLDSLYAVIFAVARRAGDEIALAFASLLFLSLVWDILVSGHSITNVDRGAFPRGSRLYLFFAYVTAVIATVEFFGSATFGEAAGANSEYLKLLGDPEFFVQLGIALYGPAMLVTLFLLRLGRFLAAGSSSAASGPAGETA